jgi:hypothetical protein
MTIFELTKTRSAYLNKYQEKRKDFDFTDKKYVYQATRSKKIGSKKKNI